MSRLIISLSSGLASGLVICSMAAVAWAGISLKPHATIYGSTVTASDIFEGSGENASVKLFRAPPPGQHVILSPGQLKTLATHAGLEWDHTLAPRKYMVHRASTIISAQTIRDELVFALEDAGVSAPLALTIRGKISDIHMDPTYPADIIIDNLSYDATNGRFSATMRAGVYSSLPKSWDISGRAFPAMEVPVLSRIVRPGVPIRREDTTWHTVRLDRVPQNAITEMSDIVGMTTRKPVKPGAVLRNNDLRPPLLVQKGDVVTLIYKVNSLKIATMAVALSDGGKNQVIRFRNIRSGKEIGAKLSEPGFAYTISTAMKLAAR
jgi:flagella basal body P-ring formation protein FlgA